MWTNVFRIGDLNTISWFQFLPCESDSTTLSEDSLRAGETDASTLSVLTAHLKLQSEGFLTTWTNSFVGPWDPSQGVHNPDEKIKLWLFLPGRHTSVTDAAKVSLSRLKVAGSGIWLAPGESEEVAFALSQSLRNRMERSLKVLSYERFGDVFTKCHSFPSTEKNSRRVQPTFEFVFSATEEAIYVLAIISTKNIRSLSSNDLERASRHCFSSTTKEGLPVIVAPSGMRGRFNGCSPSDLVKQAYSSKSSNGSSTHGMSQSSLPTVRGHNCYVEVTLGCPPVGVEKMKSKFDSSRHHILEECAVASKKSDQKRASHQLPVFGKTFIFSAEKVLVPVLHGAFTQFSFRRLWLQNWVGMYAHDMQSSWNLSGGSFVTCCLGFGSTDDIKFADDLFASSYTCPINGKSHSTSSSISSTSSTSSESDDTMASGACDLEADSDSLTCRQSGLSSSDQFGTDGSKMVSKRSRSCMTDSFGQAGTPASGISRDQYKPECSIDEAGNLVAGHADNQVECFWDWGDEDRDVEVDIQSLLLEFGDFGDFFKDDILSIGEPPGTSESQAPIFSSVDSGDVIGSPYTGRVDPPDQPLLPALSFPPLEDFNPVVPQSNMEPLDRAMEIPRNAHLSTRGGHVAAHLSGKYDYLMKSEAAMTFASEYSAVEAPKSELSTLVFRSPYLPKCKSAESAQSGHSAYVYSATPPASPHLPRSEEIDEMSSMAKSSNEVQEMSSNDLTLKCYSYVQGQKIPAETRPSTLEEMTSGKEDAISSVSIANLPSSATITQRKNTEKILEAGLTIFLPKILLATEVECSMFQAVMCSIRHTLLACNSQVLPFNRLSTAAISDQILGDPSVTSSMPLSSYDVKKDLIPVRIAGDADGMLERPFASPVGIWRTVGTAKALKPPDVLNIDSSTLSNNMFMAESFPFNGRRSVLQDFLDSLPLLVQQSSSFVDISLDACDGEGPYDWLALQEQMRRSFCCGPSMVHAGCGGLLATCHSLDIAGVDLMNPLSADVYPSSVISLLQSDVKLALRSAFGNLDGPLSMVDWCKCHNQSGDVDMHFVECNANESKDPSSTLSFGGEPISPSTALSSVTSSLKDGTRMEESSQRRMHQELDPHLKSSISFMPVPALLVGYQDDWLRTSVSSLKLWEKAPFEPYALPKPLTYYAICPDVDILTSAATDFFLQLGTVYEACKLGTHSPYLSGTQMDSASRKLSLSGLVLVDCPQSLRVGSCSVSPLGAMNDFLVALSKEWDLASFLKSLTKVVKSLKVGSSSGTQKEGSNSPCVVIYVICPFPEPSAILQTLVESSAALGSSVFASEREGQASLHSQVTKALNGASTADETAVPNVPMLSGFNIRKLVLQIVSIDLLLRVSKPMDDLTMFKEIAFTVYNKARRIPRSFYNSDMVQSSSLGRSQSTLMNVSSPTPGLWKDCLAPRMSGAQMIREGEMDSAMRHGSWDNSWQTLRTGVLNCDPNKFTDFSPQDDLRYLFEPLFILAEPGSTEAGVSASHFGTSIPESSSLRSMMDESTNTYLQNAVSGGSISASAGSLNDGSEHEHKAPSFHCCYGWTEDWRWLVSVWTDARGEFLDSQVFPFGGISSRQDTKVLQCLFVQILNQGCQVLSSLACDSSTSRARDIIITRIGCFFELECQEWQKAIHSVGGNEIRKWPIHLRQPVSAVPTSNSATLQQDMSLLQDRSIPSSPSPLYSPHSKSSSYIRGGLVQNNPKKPLSAGQVVDNSRGLFQLVQSISLIGVSMDHSLQFVCPADSFFAGGGSQTSNSSTPSSCLDGLTPMKSLGTSPHSFLFIPSARMCCIPPNPLQLPTCLTSESPPLAHLLHSKGSAIPVSTAYVASKAIPSVRRALTVNTSEEWPSILSVSLVDYYGASTDNFQEKMVRGSSSNVNSRRGRSSSLDNGREHEVDIHLILESVAMELHSLSWLTVSPAHPERRTALPFHCDTLLRLRRLLHYADKQLCQTPEKRERINPSAACQ